MIENYEAKKEREQSDTVESLAQKLYEDDGWSGNIYRRASVNLLRVYEYKAMEILEKESR
jgi:hypothetical protein